MITLVVAIARNGVIGRDGGLPWRLSSDLKRFRADTIGRPVIMGRRTFEAIGKPLPGRTNIVVTRNGRWTAEGVVTARSLEEAIALAKARADGAGEEGEICVIGGGEIYRAAMPLADRLKVTHVMAEPEGDTFFPEIDPRIWRTVSATAFPAGEKDSHATRYVIYDRVR